MALLFLKEENKSQNQDQPNIPALSLNDNESVNNLLLKKLKIALSLTSEDMLDILEKAGRHHNKRRIKRCIKKRRT